MAQAAINDVWHGLTMPHASNTGIEQRRQSRLLASFILVLMAVFTLMATWGLLVEQDAVSSPILLSNVGLLGIEFYLNRRGQYKVSAYLFVALAFLFVHILSLMSAGTLSRMYYISLVILISAIFLSMRTTLLLTMSSLCIQLVFGILAPRTGEVITAGPLFFTLVIGLVMLVFMQHRAGLEQERQAELRRALEKAQELNDLKSRFITIASHEFRTPLTTISSSTGLLERAVDKMSVEQRQKHFAKIATSVGQIVQLLDAALTFGRADADRLEFNPEALDLDCFCRHLIQEMQETDSQAMRVTLTSAGDCTAVLGDKQLLRMIFTNLISNALKFSPVGGSVRVGLSCQEGQVTLQVEDHGIGIPEADQKYIFEPFHRAGNVGTLPGAGLGLALTQKAVALHGGTIEFESKMVPGQAASGTTFRVAIPLMPHHSP